MQKTEIKYYQAGKGNDTYLIARIFIGGILIKTIERVDSKKGGDLLTDNRKRLVSLFNQSLAPHPDLLISESDYQAEFCGGGQA
ncbi:MAG: hypothetical protein PF440_01235 [Thiomicrorhabdus sp.]|jgi:hypothetical protein|nr:hypothetical protein [Thiomicrorhabdus sp.]